MPPFLQEKLERQTFLRMGDEIFLSSFPVPPVRGLEYINGWVNSYKNSRIIMNKTGTAYWLRK